MRFPPAAVRSQLQMILASEPFVRSARIQRFLTFVVEETLAGRADQLSEYTIGVSVFDRNHDFEPALDPIVRNDARRLRLKLLEYYRDGEPQSLEEIAIEIPKGSYVPVFRPATSRERNARATDRRRRVAALSFEALPDVFEAATYGRALCVSMTAGLNGLAGIEAISHGYAAGLPVRDAVSELRLTHAIHGSVLIANDDWRVTVHLIAAEDGTELWAREYDFTRESLLSSQKAITSDIRRQVTSLLGLECSRPAALAMVA